MVEALCAGVATHMIAGAYEWTDENTLDMTLRYIESPHHITIRFAFDGENVIVNRKLSTPPGYDLPPVKGTVRP
jgi:hypothetical protein